MKLIKISLLVTIMLISTFKMCLSSENIYEKNDGSTWNTFSVALKVTYLNGFYTGFYYAADLAEEKVNNIFNYLDLTMPKNIYPKQIIDGVDSFYDDYRNMNITLDNAFMYVFYSFMEPKDSELIKMIINLRKEARKLK